MRLKQLLLLGVVSVGVLSLGAGNAADETIAADKAPTTQPFVVSGNTIPSKRTEIAVRPTSTDVIQKVLVKPGQHVQKDDVLIQLDDREEQGRLKIIEADAATAEVAIRAAREELKFKEIELERFKEMGTAAVKSELRKAEQDVVQGKLLVEKSEKDYAAKQRQVEFQKQLIEDKKILAPYAGVIEEVNMWEGAMPDRDKPPMVIEQNEPLWVKVFLPTDLAQTIHERIKQNEQLKKDGKPELPLPDVRLKYADRDQAVPAKFIYFSPLADAASGMQLVRLEIPNSERRDAGLTVQITVDPMSPAGNDKGANVAQKAD